MSKKIISLATLIFTIGLTFESCKSESKSKIEATSTYKVNTNNLLVTINETGEIGSESESNVVASFSSKIDNIIDEGTIVTKNMPVGKLSTSKEEKEKDKITLTNLEAGYDIKIAEINQKKDTYRLNKEMENAKLDIKIAELKLKSLKEGRDGLAIVKAEEEINTIDREILIYESEIPERERLYKSGYISLDELQQAKVKLGELRKQKIYQTTNLKVLENGPLNEEIEKEKINLNVAQQNLQKKQQEVLSFQKTSALAIENSKVKIDKSKEKLKYYSDLVKQGDLVATDSGIVVYGKMSVGEEEVKIKAGDSVREGVSVIKIFDLKKPVLRMFVNEVDIEKIHLNQEVSFNLDSYPEQTYKGKISKISQVAEKKFEGDKNNIAVFEVTIKILKEAPVLKPGMTANIEIILDDLKNVITVPSQAVFSENNKKFCYVKNMDKIIKQPVTTGLSSEMDTEIKSGLKIGDEVITDYQEIKI